MPDVLHDAPRETRYDTLDERANFERGDWFRRCRETRMPFVVVRKSTTTADVLWDYVTLPPRCDALLRADLEGLRHRANAIFERFATAESRLRVKATLIGFDRLPRECAGEAAEALYDLIARYVSSLDDRVAPPVRVPDARPTSAASTAEPAPAPRRLWVEEIDASSAA